MKIADYHRHPAWSPTALKCAATETMAVFNHRFGPGAAPFVPSDDMNKGSLVDSLLTPPFDIRETHKVIPDDAPKRPTSTQLNAAKPSDDTKKAIEYWAKFDEAAKGFDVITQAWLTNAKAIVKALKADPDIGPVLDKLTKAASQVPHFWNDKAGRPCRMLPDIITIDGCLYDVKKTRSAKQKKFYRQAIDLGYDLQMSHLDLGFKDKYGRPPEEIGIIAFEWEPPHDCTLLILDQDDIALGLEKREEAFRRIAECQAAGVWPSHGRQSFRPERASVAPLTIDPDSIELF
jgi:hypothetical protein